jgi:hypothetical protein
MKRNFVFAAIFAIAAFAMTASAQKTDFTGTWNLDVSKSKPAETAIESQTLVVTQTATDIKVDRSTKRAAPPADGAAANPGGGRGGRGGMMGGGDGSTTYALDGKAVDSEMSGPMGSMKMSTKAKLDGGKFEVIRTMATPMGDRTSTEKWWLNSDGTLTVESTRPNREGGTDTVTRTYTKKS